jgi:hypothetical protein
VSLPALGTATRIDRFHVVGILRSRSIRLKRLVILSGGMLISSSRGIPSSPGALLAILDRAADISRHVRSSSSSGAGRVVGDCWKWSVDSAEGIGCQIASLVVVWLGSGSASGCPRD